MYCKYCGQEIKNGQEHNCEKKPPIFKWLAWFFERSGVENPFRSNHELYERGRLVTPDCVSLDEGEIPVKQYKVGILRSRMRFQRSEGRLQITNKRVLFRASGYAPGGKTIYQHAFSLDKIDGIEIRKDRRLRVPDLILVLLFGGLGTAIASAIGSLIEAFFDDAVLAGILILLFALVGAAGSVMYFFNKPNNFFKKLIVTGVGQTCAMALTGACFAGAMNDIASVLLYPLGVLCGIVTLGITILYYISAFLFVIKPNLMIEIKTSSGSPGIQIKHREMSFIWHKCEEFSGFTEILPWEDTDLAIKEVATIIDDIKTLGDMGVEKWKEN